MAKLSIAEKILKIKQDPELRKKLKSETLNIEAAAPEDSDDIQDIMSKSTLQAKANKQKKILQGIGFALIGCIGFGFLVYWLFAPNRAGMAFGYCRVFLEQQVRYPTHLELNSIARRKKFIRIWYVQTDAFGNERMERIECYHGRTAKGQYYIDKIFIERREVDPEIVARFNKSLPAIRAYPPDLTFPRPLFDALGNMDIQTYLFRKKIF